MMIVMLTILAACQQADEPTTGIMPVDITVDTRAIDGGPHEIYLNADGTTKTYDLFDDGTTTPVNPGYPNQNQNKIYIAPGTQTLPAYAWGMVNYKISDNETVTGMPVLHANPTTPVTWADDGKPTIALAMTPVTARVKLEVYRVTPTAATLHGIATPAGTWNTDAMPPIYNKVNNSTSVTLDLDGPYTQTMPGTVPTNAHLLTIVTDNKTYPIIATRPYTFAAGYQYTLTVTINTSGQAQVTDITIENFANGGMIVIGTPAPDATTHLIASEQDLKDFREAVKTTPTLNALQVANITLNDAWTPIGTYSNPYDGTYDGGGYTISGLTITGSDDYQGLFGYTAATATIKNVHIVDCNVTGYSYMGGLVGQNYGTITACSATGTVTGTGSRIGGLVGMNYGTITACYTAGTVTGGSIYIGGLVGDNDGTITACYAAGTVTGSSLIGALVGENSGATVTYSHALPTTTVPRFIGDRNNANIGPTNSIEPNAAGATVRAWPGTVTIDGKTYTGSTIWKAGDTPKLYWQ